MNPYHLFKRIAFAMDAESAHHLSIKNLSRFPDFALSLFPKFESDYDFSLKLKCGLTFPYPIGLAAGLDKNAECIDFFSKLPFGAVEVGTVTPLPQEGNPRPRLFRLKSEESLLNRMGFNNEGMDRVAKHIEQSNRYQKPLGINLGKNKITSEELAPLDYQKLYKRLAYLADYLVVNVSSPNTPGLRDLQKVDSLKVIFDALANEREQCDKPLFLKISPDISFDDVPAIVDVAKEYRLAGIIATNTTIMPNIGQGGVSGKLLKAKAKDLRSELLSVAGKESSLDIIGVGGVDCAQDVIDFWRSGGQVMQLYSSFIYQGPYVLLNIYKEIEELLCREGCTSIKDYLV